MKKLLTIVTLLPLLCFAQKRITFRPAADSTIVCADVAATYSLTAKDTIVISGNPKSVSLCHITVNGIRVVMLWDTAKVVTAPKPADDTIRFTGSYILALTPKTQKLKYTGTATGVLNLPTGSTAIGLVVYVVNNTGKTLQVNRRLYYTWKKYRVTAYPGASKLWWDISKQQWQTQQL